MYKAYETGQLMHGLTRMVRTGESYIEATKDAVDSYLCTDGRPVSTTTTVMGVIRICMDNSVIVITGCI